MKANETPEKIYVLIFNKVMTQEDIELMIKDLSARLSYGVIGLYTWKCKKSYNRELTGNLYDELCSSWSSTKDSQFLPYLRPMSSMTKEEKNDYLNTFKKSIIGTDEEDGRVWTVDSIDWLNAHHFDYRGLIEKNLALDCTGLHIYD